jgi:hypothetical protein
MLRLANVIKYIQEHQETKLLYMVENVVFSGPDLDAVSKAFGIPPAPAAAAPGALSRCPRIPRRPHPGPFPMPADACPRRRVPAPASTTGPFLMPAEARPRCRLPRLCHRPPPGRMRVPADAHPRALSRCLRAGGSASGRLWHASGRLCVCPVRRRPSGNPVRLRAALACVRLWRASGNHRQPPGGFDVCRRRRPPPGGFGVHHAGPFPHSPGHGFPPPADARPCRHPSPLLPAPGPFPDARGRP